MSGVNKAILVGNLGRDPEVRTLESGAKVATFSIATTEVFKNKNGEKVEHTEWHNLVLWRGLAEIAETYLKKGNQIYVEGRIRTRSYDDKEGIKRYVTEINVDNMTMLGGRRDSGTPPPQEENVPYRSKNDEHQQQVENQVSQQPEPEDDLPF